jgi:hypothetical protein
MTSNYPGSGRLEAVTPGGRVDVVSDQPSWLDYPTMPVFGPRGVLYIANGSLENGAPGVIALGGPPRMP